MKIPEFFYLKIFVFFFVVKCSIYLNRHVFVMSSLFPLGASGRVCFVIESFPGYLYLYFLC